MFHLALEGDGDRFESTMGMLADAAAVLGGLGRCEFFRCGIVEHEKGGELPRERLVGEYGEDVESVTNPMATGFLAYFLDGFLGGGGHVILGIVGAAAADSLDAF